MNATNERPAWFLLTRHWLSLLGVALVVTAVILWFFVLPVPIRGDVDNPYVGIVAFLLLPLVFFAAVTLVPIGIYLSKRRIRKRVAETETPFEFDVLLSQCRKCSQWTLTHG
jgi:hypothetical protein